MKKEKTGYDIIGEEVRRFWALEGLPCEVICYFKHKYSFEKEWRQERVYATSTSSYIDDTDVEFSYDFWEGESDYKDIKIYELEDILDIFDEYNEGYF